MRVRTPTTPPTARPTAAPHPHHHHHGMSPAAIAGAAVAGALIALAFGATSAAAQAVYDDGTYVDEFVVTAPVSRDGPNRLSQRVSLRDLDLTTYSGQNLMRLRVRDTAIDLCRRLGERSRGECVDQAIRDARPQMRTATRYAYANRDRAYAYLDRPYAYLDQPYPYDYRVYP